MLNNKRIQALFWQIKRRELSTNHKETDGDGLYLRGGRYWRFDYRYGGKRKTLSLGTYPDVSLAMARTAHQEARTLLAKGEDPMEIRNAAKFQEKAEAQESALTFEVVARE